MWGAGTGPAPRRWEELPHGSNQMQSFRTLEHIADVGFEAFASTREEAFPNAARALMNIILGLMAVAFVFIPSTRGLSSSVLLYKMQEVKPKVFAWIPEDVINQDADPLYERPATAG